MECRPINPPKDLLACEECGELNRHDDFEMVYKEGEKYGWFLCPDCADKKRVELEENRIEYLEFLKEEQYEKGRLTNH